MVGEAMPRPYVCIRARPENMRYRDGRRRAVASPAQRNEGHLLVCGRLAQFLRCYQISHVAE